MKDWQVLARTVFGSATRYEICTWIAQRENPVFFPSEMAKDGGSYVTTHGALFDRLVAARLISRISGEGQRVALYRRLDSPIWAMFRDAAQTIGGPFVDTSRQVNDMRTNLLSLAEKLHE